MFRRIRSRLIAAFAVPLALLVAVASVAAWGSYRSERSVSSQSALAIAANGPSGIVNALQNERDEATADLVGVAGEAKLPVKSNADARHQTDVALAAFRSSVDSAGGSAEKVFGPALAALSQLDSVRHQVDAFTGTKSLGNPKAAAADVASFDQYATLIDGFLKAVAVAPQYISDPSLRSSVETLDLFLNQSESLTLVAQQMFAASILQSGKQAGTIVAGVDLGAFQVWTDRLEAFTTGPDGPVVASVVRSANQAAAAMTPFVREATLGLPLNVVAFEQALLPIGNVWQAASGAVGQHISHRAASLRTSAELRTTLYGAGAVVAILLVLLLLLRVSRSISAPLTQLAGDARRIAEVDLPAAVEAIFNPPAGAGPSAGSTDEEPATEAGGLQEVTEVAGALGEVQRKALELATEQATLRHKVAEAFVNLGRRNQNLVARQLELITQIEQQEDDPSTLEDLFRLDHLTTRMRRHAESLLVIAGSGALRPWSEAASAVDVVRAASAEVEDYQRLRLHHFDHAVIAAAATTDLVHILAELLENGLSFSPPHASVGLYGRALESGYTISVVDAGIGMAPDVREAANRRLASGGDLDDAANRCLGLVVAGRLAARHGITVTLHDSEVGGVTARVTIPAALIESSVAGPAESGAAPVTVEPPVGEPAGAVRPASGGLPDGHLASAPGDAGVGGGLTDTRLGAGLDARFGTGAVNDRSTTGAVDSRFATGAVDSRFAGGVADGRPGPGGVDSRFAVAPDRRLAPVPSPSTRSGALPVPAAAEAPPNENRFETAPVVDPAGDAKATDRPGPGAGLPRRVPGATLGQADESLRRDRTPATQTPWAVSYALTDYLNNRAEPQPGRPPTED